MRSPRTMEKRVLASKGILRSLSVALFLLVMSSLANSVPLTQLNRATGKLTVSSCSRLTAVVLKSEACHSVAENSIIIDERGPVTIEAASIEFTPAAIKENNRSQLFSSVSLEAVGTHGPSKVELFAGKLNTTVVNVTLNPRLSGVTKLKVHSFPPKRCVKATLWVCFHPEVEKKSVKLDPGIYDQQDISKQKDIPLRKQQQQDGGGGDLILNSWRAPTANSKLHKIIKRAAGIAMSNAATTPRTYSWLQAAVVGCISIISMAVLPSLFIALICCNKKKSQLRETDKKLIISEKAPPFTSTNNPMGAPSMSSLDKMGECKSLSKEGDVNGSVYDLTTPTVSTFHSVVQSNTTSLTDIPDASSVNSTPLRAPPPPQVSTSSSSPSNSSHLHPKLRRVSQQVQTVDMSPMTPPSLSDTKGPAPKQNILQLAPPPPAKSRPSQVVVTSSTDDLLYCPDDEETNTFSTFKAVQKQPAKRTLTSESVSSIGSESVMSYVLTQEMLAGGQRSRSGTIGSLQSQSSTFSDTSATPKRTSTGSSLQYQQYLSPSIAATSRGNRNSLCEDQLIASSATVEVRQHAQSGPVHDKDDAADQNGRLPLKLPRHLRVEQSRPFSAGYLPDEVDFATPAGNLSRSSPTATVTADSELDAKSSSTSSNLTSPTVRLLHSLKLLSQSSQEESTLDRGTRTRNGSLGLIHSREGSEVFDDGVETASLNSLNSPCRASPTTAQNKKGRKFNKKKRKLVSPPHTPPPLPPTPPPPSTLPPGPPIFSHPPPAPPSPSSLPPGPPTFSPPIPPPPSSLPPGPPTLISPPIPPPPSTLPPGPPTFPYAPPTPPPPLTLPPGPPSQPFPPPTPPPRAKRVENDSSTGATSIRNSMESDLGDLEAVQPGAQQENYPMCVCCGIRIDENNTAQRQEDPVYLCVLPDSDHEACPVDATSESNAVDTTDADTCTADSTDSTPKKKFLRKEDSAASYHVLEQGKLICMDCLNRDGPIYHELEVVQSDSELLTEEPSPPVPPRQRRPKPKDPIYERVGSINKNQLKARTVSASSEEGSYITNVGRKPRSLYLDSSSDYESVQSQTNTSPFFHSNISAQQLAAKFEQRGKQSEPLPSPPSLPPHRNRPHPPPLTKLRGQTEHSTSNHDYESVSSFEHSHVKRKVSDHDYAHIGPAPSMESLDEPLNSPPYVPDGATRAKLLKIDSQGYATVIPADEVLDSDEVDCLQFSDNDQCPVDPSQLTCQDSDNWREQRENGYAPLTPQRRRESSKSASRTVKDNENDECKDEPPPPSPPLSTTPQDYEVPMNILQQSPSRNSAVVSPARLTRQRAVSSTSEAETKRLSCVSKGSCGDVMQEADERKLENGREAKVAKEVEGHDEVFDSGVETSVDSQDGVQTAAASSKGSSSSVSHEPIKLEGHSVELISNSDIDSAHKQEHQKELTASEDRANGTVRPRSMTVHVVTSERHTVNGGDGGEEVCVRYDGTRLVQRDGGAQRGNLLHQRQTSVPALLQPNALHISLDQNRHAIV